MRTSAFSPTRQGDRFVEVGVWRGRSVCFLGEMARRRGIDVRILAVDTFDPNSDLARRHGVVDLEAEFARNVTRQGLADVVDVRVGRSVEVARTLPESFALAVMIDADHSEAATLDDMGAWFPRVRPGGWLLGHDWTFATVRRAVRVFAASHDLNVELSGDRVPCWMIRKPEALLSQGERARRPGVAQPHDEW